MECVNIIFPVILYILGTVLLVSMIILVVKCIGTVKRINTVVEDVSNKASKLDGVFHLIDNTTDIISGISDKAIDFIMGLITGLFTRKKKNIEEEENEK